MYLLSRFPQVLAEREAAIETLRVTIAGFQAEQDNIDEALKQLEDQIADKDNEILNLNQTIDSLHDQLYRTEDEADHLKETIERMQEDEDVEKQVSAALKEVCSSIYTWPHTR